MQSTSISKHSFKTRASIFHDSLGQEHCDLVLSAYSESQKIDNTGPKRDNLLNTERTGWDIHKNPLANSVWKEVSYRFSQLFHDDMFHPGLEFVELNVFESWIGVSQENAVVEPHHHGACPFSWSFVFYAKIPNLHSSLNFVDFSYDHLKIKVREGDVLWFPSNIGHYSNDTAPGRTVFSGNFSVSMNMKGN
jgi:hypothetical protein